MNILEKIIARKAKEVVSSKLLVPTQILEASPYFNTKVNSLSKAILDAPKFGIIAEHKRKSPSKGIINDQLELEFIVDGYVEAECIGLSILTDTPFFGGSYLDLMLARKTATNTPIIRKDFIIDPYQILEARAWGADVVLLIAANLTVAKCNELAKLAQSLGLETLLEVHSREEIKKYLNDNINMVGVNNRDLKTFEVSIDISIQLVDYIPNHIP